VKASALRLLRLGHGEEVARYTRHRRRLPALSVGYVRQVERLEHGKHGALFQHKELYL
jgi:hypothetical protein